MDDEKINSETDVQKLLRQDPQNSSRKTLTNYYLHKSYLKIEIYCNIFYVSVKRNIIYDST